MERENNLTGNDRLIVGRWKKYFYESLDMKDDVEIREREICHGYEDQIEPQRKDEMWEIIKTLENNKLQAEGNISAEVIEYGDKKFWEEICALMEVT
jgi:hypothetical protein